MSSTIIKFLIGGIGIYVCGRLAWSFYLKYKVNKLNKVALIGLDNQIKKLIKKLEPADIKATEQIAKLNQKKKNIEKLTKLIEEKLENDN
jgi:predicted transcriptional regulator